MVRALFVGCSVLLVGIISLYAASERAGRADFVYVNPSGVHTLDPARMSWTPDLRLAYNLWEGLTDADPRTGRPVAGTALLPPKVSPDGLRYTFTIRGDARWSNGDAVTSADFVRGWRRAVEPGTAADYMVFFTDHIAGVADYVDWRLRGVSALTALLRLSDGWGIDAEQARALVHDPVFSDIRAAVESFGGAIFEGEHDDAFWKAAARRFNESDADWSTFYDRLFERHAAEFAARFDAVGIKAVDDHTLQVELTRPCPYFLDLTAFPTFLPCHKSIEVLRERSRGAPFNEQGLVVYDPQWTKPDYRRNGYGGLVTNGPYRLAEWTFKRRVRLTVNPCYRAGGDIRCSSIDMLVYENASAALMAYEAGDVDFLPGMDVPYDHEIARLARSGERPDFHLCDVLATYFFNFNCISDSVLGRSNPFIDARVRRAFALAVDKESIVSEVLGRGDRVAYTFVPRGAIPGYDPPEWTPGDADEARRLLREAGYADGGALPTIDLLYLASDERVCQAVAYMWERELGANVELRCKERKTFAEDKADHRFMIARGNWYGDYYDPTTFLDCLVTGNGNNDSGYSNARYDALMARAKETRSAARRAELLKQAERIPMTEDFPILPILHYALPIAINPHIRGLYPNPRLRFPFKYVTVQP